MHSSHHPARPAYTTYQLQRDNSLPQKTHRTGAQTVSSPSKAMDKTVERSAWRRSSASIRIERRRMAREPSIVKTTAFTRSQRSRQIERTFSSRKRSINTRCSFRQLLIDSSYQPGILLQLFGRERNHLDRRSISAIIDSIVYNGSYSQFSPPE